MACGRDDMKAASGQLRLDGSDRCSDGTVEGIMLKLPLL
jgi:hypothetical protein